MRGIFLEIRPTPRFYLIKSRRAILLGLAVGLNRKKMRQRRHLFEGLSQQDRIPCPQRKDIRLY